MWLSRSSSQLGKSDAVFGDFTQTRRSHCTASPESFANTRVKSRNANYDLTFSPTSMVRLHNNVYGRRADLQNACSCVMVRAILQMYGFRVSSTHILQTFFLLPYDGNCIYILQHAIGLFSCTIEVPSRLSHSFGLPYIS